MRSSLYVKNLHIFYNNEGTGDPILILHGWGSRSSHWVKTQTELAKCGYRVIIPDLPGFGQSDEPKENWSLAEYSDLIHKFAEKLGLRYFTLVGHSLGGRIAIDYASRYQNQLHVLVLMDAAGIMRRQKLKTRLFLLLTKIGNLIFELPILIFLQKPVRKIWYRLTRTHDYYRASPKMRSVMRRILEENIRQYLPRITKPTLILWGEKDFITPVDDALIIHNEIPLTHLHIFPNLGHAIHLQAPLDVAQQIDKFLKQYR